jgi:peroxiredoxin
MSVHESKVLRLRSLFVISNVLLALSLGANLLLLSNLKRAGGVIASIKADARLHPGDKAPDFPVRLFDNTEMQFGHARLRPVLLYVFSPSCHFCARNLPAINALSQKLKNRIDVIGFSLTTSDLIPYLRANQLSFPVIRDADPSFVSAYRLSGTPETIAISKTGYVENVWMGSYEGDVRTAIQRTYGVDLPLL